MQGIYVERLFSNTEDFAFTPLQNMSTKKEGFSLTRRRSTGTYTPMEGMA